MLYRRAHCASAPCALLAAALAVVPFPSHAQERPAEIGETDSLQVDPQTGATIVPDQRPDQREVPTLPTADPLPPPAGPVIDTVDQNTIFPPPAVNPGVLLPEPTRDPLAIDRADDPILNLVRRSEDAARFRRILATAIATNPATDEALARTAEARASEDLAISGRYPVADFTLSYYGTVARNFSDDPGNVLERSRPRSRADALINIQQPLLDFGATSNRIAAERDRVAAAGYGEQVTAAQVALGGVNAWNGVFGYRALVQLGEAFQASQVDLRGLIEERIASGVSAAGDYAQVASYIASADARLADYRRAVASAEANFRELAGVPPPSTIGPAPALAPIPTLAEAESLAAIIPAVLAAPQASRCRRARDLRAVKADQLPRITAGVNGRGLRCARQRARLRRARQCGGHLSFGRRGSGAGRCRRGTRCLDRSRLPPGAQPGGARRADRPGPMWTPCRPPPLRWRRTTLPAGRRATCCWSGSA